MLAMCRVEELRLRAANDNPHPNSGNRQRAFDPLLIDALRHFARHGLDAAPRARSAAQAALAGGSQTGFDHWVAITGMFDPRLARQTARAAVRCED